MISFHGRSLLYDSLSGKLFLGNVNSRQAPFSEEGWLWDLVCLCCLLWMAGLKSMSALNVVVLF